MRSSRADGMARRGWHAAVAEQTGLSSGFGFVDFFETEVAESAMQALNGRVVYDRVRTGTP